VVLGNTTIKLDKQVAQIVALEHTTNNKDDLYAKHVPMVNTMIKLDKLPNPVVKTIVMLAPILILIKLRV